MGRGGKWGRFGRIRRRDWWFWRAGERICGSGVEEFGVWMWALDGSGLGWRLDLGHQVIMVRMGEKWGQGGNVIGSGKGQRRDFLENRKALPTMTGPFQGYAIEVYPLVLSLSKDALVVLRQAPAGGGFSRGEPGGVPRHERDMWLLWKRPAAMTLPHATAGITSDATVSMAGNTSAGSPE